MGHFAGFFAEVQLQVNVGQVQMAKRKVISVAGDLTGAPSSVERLNPATVLAAQVIQVSNVVIRLGHKQRHVVLLAKCAGSLVGGQSARKIVQAY